MLRPSHFAGILCVLSALVCTGCATLGDEHCASPDWTRIGETDAYRLRPLEFELKHKKVCGEERVNAVEYEAGYLGAMRKMCNAEYAFIFGYLNKAPNSKCVADANLDANYKSGVECRTNLTLLRNLEAKRRDELEREKVEAEKRKTEAKSRSFLDILFSGDTRLDSEKTRAEIQAVEETQRGYSRTYEGALIRAEYIDGLSSNYDY
jgi:hypothetical protein